MAWLRSVYFLDQYRGWVAGSGGTLLQTTDGGETWKRLLPLTRGTLHDVYFADDHVGWLVAELVESNSSFHVLKRVFFADRDHGWAVGFGGTILKYGRAAAPQLKN